MNRLTHSLLVLSFGISLLEAKSARGDTGFFGGAMCLPRYNATAADAKIARDVTGIYKWGSDSNGWLLECPIQIGTSGSIDPTGARMKVFEDSVSGSVDCTLTISDDSVLYFTGARFGCNAAGGCTSVVVNDVMTSDNYLDWKDSELPSGSLSGELYASFFCAMGANTSGGTVAIYNYELSY